ncbi:HAD family phosphatase [Aeromicrobium sp.]|nr:HAD family phosphatase [Candidatus Saccharibacteria bacterium]
MIRGILLDYGGVMATGGKGADLASRVAGEVGLSASDTKTFLAPLWRKMTRGTLTTDQFWTAIETHQNQSISDTQRHSWDDWWSTELRPEMVSLVETLKQQGYPVGLLSNIIPGAAEVICAAGSYDIFDFTVLSYEVGCAKPEPEIYDLALSHFTDIQSEEVVFIDDQQKCMPPAQALGIHTIIATSSEQIIADLRKLDVAV